MNIRQMLVSSNKYSIKCPYTLNPETITIHNTYNDASANNEVQYMIANNKEVSFHIAVDDKEAVQGLPLDRNAWAAGDGAKGDGNRKSIHIEICYSKSGGTRYYLAEGNAIKLTAQMLHERGWGVDRIRKHEDWSGKHCPHRILDEGRWNQVVNAIASELNRLKQPPTSIVYQSHVQDVGWQAPVYDGQTSGTTGQGKRLEALTIRLQGEDSLSFEAHVQKIGWTAPRTNGEVVGTIGEGLRIEAIKINCDKHNIQYRTHVEGIGWQEWKKNGEISGTVGESRRLEAIEIKLV